MKIDWKEIDGTTNGVEEVFDDHPYKEFENTPVWDVLEKGITELTKNGDLEQCSYGKYIIGYLCKQLHLKKLIAPAEPMCDSLSSAKEINEE
jgi:hypothetical protein